MIDDARLDHVAIAVERHADGLALFAGELGGRWGSAGESVGFAPAQLVYSNDMRLELLAPNAVEDNDFLRRFLDRQGPGPHHLTYKVADLDAALEECEAAGLHPVNVDRSDPGWQEAFLHPKEALGIVVQLAQSSGPEWQTPPPADLPESRPSSPARLDHVGHAVASLPEGLDLFAGLLGGRKESSGRNAEAAWIELSWPGPGSLRLVAPAGDSPALRSWLAGRSGRLHHVAFSCDEPEGVPGGRPGPHGEWVLEPTPAVGTRLVLSQAG